MKRDLQQYLDLLRFTWNGKEGIRRGFVLLILFSFVSIHDGYGQFVNVEINIEPRVNTTVEQSLNFGQAVVGSGLVEIPIGSPNMGIFQIRALRAQQLLLSVEVDDDLVHESPNIDARIPLNLRASVTNVGLNDYRQSIPMSSTLQTLIVNPPPQAPEAVWSSIFVYVYGSLNISNVPVGTYRGQVLLTIIYE